MLDELEKKKSPGAAPQRPPVKSADRVMWLGHLNGAETYLEIGVSKGNTFNAVDLGPTSLKVGVDPKFQFDTKELESETCKFFHCTSDTFFSDAAPSFKPFDLIFLDGLHTFEQTLRDFCASVSFAHDRTIWLVDDIWPGSIAQADPDLRRVRKLKSLINEEGGAWMGDVYKTVAAINDFFPQFCWAILPGHGQLVVWRGKRQFKPVWNSMEAISRLTYADFVLGRESFFSPLGYQEVQHRVSTALSRDEI